VASCSSARSIVRAWLRCLPILPPCTIGLEACSGAHQLARELAQLGHTVRIIAAKFVAPYRTSGKNDRNDARAIVDALLHPRTRFVPVTTLEQQALLSLLRARHGYVCERTALVNRIRGLLAEFGVTLPRSVDRLRKLGTAAAETLPALAREVIAELLAHLRVLDERIPTGRRAKDRSAPGSRAKTVAPPRTSNPPLKEKAAEAALPNSTSEPLRTSRSLRRSSHRRHFQPLRQKTRLRRLDSAATRA
jgi:transposase